MGLCVVGQVRLLLCRDPKLLPWLGLELTEARELHKGGGQRGAGAFCAAADAQGVIL